MSAKCANMILQKKKKKIFKVLTRTFTISLDKRAKLGFSSQINTNVMQQKLIQEFNRSKTY